MALFPQGLDYTIIFLIGEDPGMRAKQVYRNALRHSNRVFTYQAVHKRLVALEKLEIINKREYGYTINPSWIDQVDTFIHHIRNSKPTLEKRELTIREIYNSSQHQPFSTVNNH